MSSLKSFLSTIFSPKGSSVLGLDVGSSSIKVVQLRKKGGRAVLETYGELALGPYTGTEIGRAAALPTETLTEALKDVLREAHVTTNQCGMSIPIASSLVSVIEMPAFDERHLAQMVPIEARKYIPVPIAEVTLDWSLIPKDEASSIKHSEPVALPEQAQNPFARPATPPPNRITEKVEVLVVAIHNDALSRYQAIAEGAGLVPSFLEIEVFSTIRAVLEPGPLPQMIFDMGAAVTKLYIIERGIIRSSHMINRGSQDVTLALSKALNIPVKDAEMMKRGQGPAFQTGGVPGKDIASVVSGSLGYIFGEANRALGNFERRSGKNVNRIVLSGGGVNTEGLLELAKQSFAIPVELADPFAKVEAPAFLGDILKKTGPEFAVALGVALRRLQEVE